MNIKVNNINRIKQNLKLFEEMKERFLEIKKRLKLIERLNTEKNVLENNINKNVLVFYNLNVGVRQL